MNLNAGQRLLECQQAQGTNLCIGLDPHYDPNGKLNAAFYGLYADSELVAKVETVATALRETGFARIRNVTLVSRHITGVIGYLEAVVSAAWGAGARVFKPQSAFYEALGPFYPMALTRITEYIRMLADRDRGDAFIILDAKRGDILTTQLPYYQAYLTRREVEVIPGMDGQFDFDAMTVTTWMGTDVLMPGLPFFQDGKAAIVVTRTSNASGTTLQDLIAVENTMLVLPDKAEKYRVTEQTRKQLSAELGRGVTAHEVMLHLTEEFVRANGLIADGVSPIFSVMGSTVRFDAAFRLLRPSGTALIPGFGAQEGEFGNIIPLIAIEGPLAGHGVILASSRNHNYPWLARFGGDDDPNPANLSGHMVRVIDEFRRQEQEAYRAHGIPSSI